MSTAILRRMMFLTLTCSMCTAAFCQSYQEKLDSLFARLESTYDPKIQIQLYIEISSAYGRVNPDSLRYHATILRDLSKREMSNGGLAQAYSYLGLSYYQKQEYENGIKLYDSAINLHQSLGNEGEVANALTNQGHIFFSTGSPEEAKSRYQKSYSISKKLNKPRGMGNSAGSLGLVYRYLKMYDSALTYYTEAYEHYSSIEFKEGIMSVSSNIGNIYAQMGNHEKSIEITQKALKLARELGHKRSISIALNNIGDGYNQLSRFEEGLPFLKEALSLHENMGNTYAVAVTCGAIGNSFIGLNRQDSARIYLKKAGKIAASQGRKSLQLSIEKQLAELLYNQKRYSEALDVLEEAFEISTDPDLSEHKEDILEKLLLIYEKMGDFESGLKSANELMSLRDSLAKETSESEMNELVAKYELLEKENEILTLSKSQEINQLEIKQQRRNFLSVAVIATILVIALILVGFQRLKLKRNDRLLRRTLSEKDILLKEIHHRVKNNLQVISSLLSVQSQQYDHPAIENFVQDGRARVQAMALVHQFLYQGTEDAIIAYDEYLKTLTDSIVAFHDAKDRISYLIDAESIGLDIDTAIPLGLIANEIITNALKHAFDELENGQLEVGFHRKGDEVILTVKDNGKGFNVEDLNKRDSFGMNLVNNLVKKLKGNLSIENGMGTQFTLVFQNNPKAA